MNIDRYFMLRITTSIIALVTLAACDLLEPVQYGGFTLTVEAQEISHDKSQAICHAIEDAGYVMPYGPVISWYQFEVSRLQWILTGPRGKLLTVPDGQASMFIMVDWSVPADMNRLPDAVTQETVDQLAKEARNICRIVQQEATRQGIGQIPVKIRLFDLVVGFELEYGRYMPEHREGGALVSTSDCDKLQGFYIGKSIGLNPEKRTPGRCPSLYVPN